MSDHNYEISNKNKLILIYYAGLCCAIVLTNLDVTMVNLALSDIANDLNLNLKNTEYISNIYLMSALVSFIFFGKLGQIMSSHRVFLLGLGLFLVGTSLCSFVLSPSGLIVGRSLQGFGFSASFSMTFILIKHIMPESKLHSVMGITTAVSGITQALGPSLGALILSNFPWNYIFIFKIPFIILALCLSVKFYPFEKTKIDLKKIKQLQTPFFLMFLLCLIVLIFESNNMVLHCITTSFLVGVILYKREIINVLFSSFVLNNLKFRLSLAARATAMFYFYMLFFILPLYLKNILNFSVTSVSHVLFYMTVCYAIMSLVYAYVVNYFRISFYSFPILQTISVLLFLLYIALENYYFLSFGFIIAGLSFGISFPQSLNMTLNAFSSSQTSNAVSIFCTVSFISSAIAIKVCSFLLEKMSHLYVIQIDSIPNTPALDRFVLHAQGLRPLLELDSKDITNIARLSFENAFIACLIICIITNILLVWFFRKSGDT